MSQLLCGAAERVITPELGLDIPGYFFVRTATGVKSDLYTQAVVLSREEETLVVISMDILDFQAGFAKEIRKRLAEQIGVKPSSVMITATHAHTGQPTDYTGFCVKKNTRAMKRLANLTVEAVLEAYEKRREARLGFGVGEEKGISFNRNFYMKDGSIKTNPGKRFPNDIVKPVSEIDHSVNVLRFDDEQGKTVAQIVNFACHPDVVGGTEYCADYPGELRRVLKERFGQDSVLVYLNGCAGNINHIDAFRVAEGYRYPKDHYVTMGETLAKEVLRIHEGIRWTEDTELSAMNQSFRARRRQPTEEQLSWAREILRADAPGESDLVYAKEWIYLHEHPMRYCNVEVQVLRIGDCALVGLPGEIYSDTGLAIKEISPFGRNMVAQLANGTVGYVVTEPCFTGGVYESKLARYNSSVYPEAADRMVATAQKLMKKLRS